MKTHKKTSRFALTATLIAFSLGLLPPTVEIMAEGTNNSAGSVSIGKLIRSGRTKNGTPKFSLLDDSGNVTAHVIPVTGLNLGKHVNQRVGVTARRVKTGQDKLLYILAQNVTSLEKTKSPDSDALVDLDEEFGLEETDEIDSDLFAELDLVPAGNSVAPAAAVLSGPRGEEVIVDGGTSIVTDGQILEELPETIIEDGVAIGSGFAGAPIDGCASCFGGSCVSPCGPGGGPWGNVWIRAEYLLWWTKGMDVPALVSTGPSSQLPQNAGVIGQSGTEILYGDGRILDSSRNGGRFRMGRWCNFCDTVGWDVDFFFLPETDDVFSQVSTGAPILARPFFNTELGRNDSELVAYPGIVNGSMTVTTTSEMYSVSPRIRYNLCNSDMYLNPANACSIPDGCGGVACPQQVSQRLDLLLGYRYSSLDETLRTRELLSTTQNGLPTTFDLQDVFRTENDFHGFEIGLEWDRYRGPWSLEWIGRVALGNNREIVTIDGSTTSSTNGVDFQDPAGLLALSSNIGTYKNNNFAAIPEMNVTLGYLIGPSLRFTIGYTILYWNEVVRPGTQIDTSINPNLIPPVQSGGANRPAATLTETDIWAQGMSFGLDYRW